MNQHHLPIQTNAAQPNNKTTKKTAENRNGYGGRKKSAERKTRIETFPQSTENRAADGTKANRTQTSIQSRFILFKWQLHF